ncbi:unnamed protein product, partial [Iphiclides podalirius]
MGQDAPISLIESWTVTETDIRNKRAYSARAAKQRLSFSYKAYRLGQNSTKITHKTNGEAQSAPPQVGQDERGVERRAFDRGDALRSFTPRPPGQTDARAATDYLLECNVFELLKFGTSAAYRLATFDASRLRPEQRANKTTVFLRRALCSRAVDVRFESRRTLYSSTRKEHCVSAVDEILE